MVLIFGDLGAREAAYLRQALKVHPIPYYAPSRAEICAEAQS